MRTSAKLKAAWPFILSTILIAACPIAASANTCQDLFGPARFSVDALERLSTQEKRISSLKDVELNTFEDLKKAFKAVGLESQLSFFSRELSAQVYEYSDGKRVITLYAPQRRIQLLRQADQAYPSPFSKTDLHEIASRVSTLRPDQSYEFTKQLDLEQFRFEYLVLSPSKATRFNDRSELHRLLRSFGFAQIRTSKVAEHLGDITIWSSVVTYQNSLTNQRISFTVRPERAGMPPQVYEDPGQVIGLLRKIHDALTSGEDLNDALYARSQ
jgi:hypothetical protein